MPQTISNSKVPQKTIVYIDGFNVYYSLLKRTPYKWLNLRDLMENIFPGDRNDIIEIKYFTALVRPRLANPDQLIHQQVYIRALETLENFKVIYGSFLSNPVKLPSVLSQFPLKLGPTIRVLKTEEKGSDVNLAVHLMKDACENRFEVAIVVTNDSDFALPIEIIKREFGKAVIVAYPTPHVNDKLKTAASFVRKIRGGPYLSKFQFPQTLTDSVGTITKPLGW